eukprot:7389556-Prymnesium_polylepis.2
MKLPLDWDSDVTPVARLRLMGQQSAKPACRSAHVTARCTGHRGRVAHVEQIQQVAPTGPVAGIQAAR